MWTESERDLNARMLRNPQAGNEQSIRTFLSIINRALSHSAELNAVVERRAGHHSNSHEIVSHKIHIYGF